MTNTEIEEVINVLLRRLGRLEQRVAGLDERTQKMVMIGEPQKDQMFYTGNLPLQIDSLSDEAVEQLREIIRKVPAGVGPL